MNTSNNNIQDFLKAKLEIFRNWLFRYSKVIMPVVLVLCVVGTVAVAISANKRKIAEEERAEAANESNIEVADNLIAVPEVPLQQDAVPEINELFSTYYTAMVDGDTDTMSRLVDHLDATEILRAQETSKYIESYPTLEVYTKAGPKDGTYVAYVYAEVKFKDYEKPVPGMRVYYVCTNENGEYYINEDGEENEAELNYIRELNLQDDVVDLNNRAAVAYNDMLAEDEVLAGFIVDLNSEIDKNVGEALARAEGSSPSDEAGDADGQAPADEQVGDSDLSGTEEPAVVVTKVKAIDVVNIRTSDSETADKLGKAAVGDEFTLLEEKGNGWSKISYEGGEAYIKSEFLEPSETMQADAGETSENTDETPDDEANADQQQEDNSSSAQTTGTVTVKENVRVRASANENGEKLGTVYIGEKLEVIMKQADGWTKIKYNGQTAYVKSDYVE
ncbi:MAG: SH3 domain-containing protein, partial [Lachnospiraceae bacterium]|nr:SH3 domain-containing protein [Lachnospiraceae bacterium]